MATPSRTDAKAAAGGFFPGIILVWVLGEFGVTMPAEVAASISAGLMLLVAFIVRLTTDAKGKHARE